MSILEILGLIAALITIGSFVVFSTKKIRVARNAQRERLLDVQKEIEEYAQKATTQAKRQDLFILISEELANARHFTSLANARAQKSQILTLGVVTLWAFVYVDVEPEPWFAIPMWTASAFLVAITIHLSYVLEKMNESISFTSQGFRNAMEAHLKKNQGSFPIDLL